MSYDWSSWLKQNVRVIDPVMLGLAVLSLLAVALAVALAFDWASGY